MSRYDHPCLVQSKPQLVSVTIRTLVSSPSVNLLTDFTQYSTPTHRCSLADCKIASTTTFA
jgi:hypothetical protein